MVETGVDDEPLAWLEAKLWKYADGRRVPQIDRSWLECHFEKSAVMQTGSGERFAVAL